MKDVCRAALHVATVPAGANKIFNLNDDTQMGMAEFFRYMAGLTGAKFVELPAVPIESMKTTIHALAETMQKITGMLGFPSPLEADPVVPQRGLRLRERTAQVRPASSSPIPMPATACATR